MTGRPGSGRRFPVDDDHRARYAAPVHDDDHWMRLALAEAAHAASLGEVPVGAVLVSAEGELLGAGHNLRETLHDPTAHAEIVALRGASRRRGSWRLDDATLFVTLEPCTMCAGAMVSARIARLVFGTRDAKAGAVLSHFQIGQGPPLNHRFSVREGVLDEESRTVLQAFFRGLRAMGEK